MNNFIFLLLSIYILVHSHGEEYHEKSLRVVNGDIAPAGMFPYMVALKTTINGINKVCGGTLIHQQLVLTAAKCLYGAQDVEVTVGAHDLTKLGDAQVFKLTSQSFIIHEFYNNSHVRHDIAVIVLNEPVKLVAEKVQTIRIPQISDLNKNYDGLSAIIAGWGKTNGFANKVSEQLNYGRVTIIPLLSCQIIHILDPLNLDQMCTSGVSKVNICLGDNGGPLIVDNVQVGIASFGNDVGCDTGFPGVHTRLTSYVTWLNHTLAKLPLVEPFYIM